MSTLVAVDGMDFLQRLLISVYHSLSLEQSLLGVLEATLGIGCHGGLSTDRNENHRLKAFGGVVNDIGRFR